MLYKYDNNKEENLNHDDDNHMEDQNNSDLFINNVNDVMYSDDEVIEDKESIQPDEDCYNNYLCLLKEKDDDDEYVIDDTKRRDNMNFMDFNKNRFNNFSRDNYFCSDKIMYMIRNNSNFINTNIKTNDIYEEIHLKNTLMTIEKYVLFFKKTNLNYFNNKDVMFYLKRIYFPYIMYEHDDNSIICNEKI